MQIRPTLMPTLMDMLALGEEYEDFVKGRAMRKLLRLRKKHGPELPKAYHEARLDVKAELDRDIKRFMQPSVFLTRDDMDADYRHIYRSDHPRTPLEQKCYTMLKGLEALPLAQARHQSNISNRQIGEGVALTAPFRR